MLEANASYHIILIRMPIVFKESSVIQCFALLKNQRVVSVRCLHPIQVSTDEMV